MGFLKRDDIYIVTRITGSQDTTENDIELVE